MLAAADFDPACDSVPGKGADCWAAACKVAVAANAAAERERNWRLCMGGVSTKKGLSRADSQQGSSCTANGMHRFENERPLASAGARLSLAERIGHTAGSSSLRTRYSSMSTATST